MINNDGCVLVLQSCLAYSFKSSHEDSNSNTTLS